MPVRAKAHLVTHGAGVAGARSKSVNATFTALNAVNVAFTDFRRSLKAGRGGAG